MSMMKCNCNDTHDPCCCAACVGLETAERPLFGTGQTLTAADLTALQDYVQTKNRLHNRYQHGWGVVCGLEVLCHDCEGSVSIRPGYAIDPCGDDIVVGDAVRYDVIEAIRDCTRVARKRPSDCDPWVPPQDEGCGDALSYWCVALEYREVETAVGQRLTTGGQACDTIGKGGGGSCGCGGGCGGDCGCGGQKARTKPVTSYTPPSIVASNACAPRRVRECFDVTLIPRKEPCSPSLTGRDTIGVSDNQPLGLIGYLIPEKSLLRNILDCVIKDVQTVTERLTTQDQAVIAQLASGTPTQLAASGLNLDQVHLAICHMRAAVLEILQDDNGTTRCQLLRATAEVKLAPPEPSNDSTNTGGENRADYIARAQQMAADLLAAWIQAILDCICRAFLPRCPEDPCDARVELACITVKNGKILSICNHSCRKYAGAFPSTFYWMSLIPLIPLFARALASLCCRPDLLRRNSPLVNDLMPLLDQVDPTGNLRREIAKDDFALPRRYVAMAAKFADTPVLPALSQQFEKAATSVIKPKDQATTPTKPDVDNVREELAALRAEVTAIRAEMAPVAAAPTKAPAKRRAPTKGTSKSTKPRKG